MNPVPTPSEDAVELVRAWLVGDTLESTVRAAVFEDPARWGVVFAELAREIALGLQQEEGADPARTLQAIRETFVAELAESLP